MGSDTGYRTRYCRCCDYLGIDLWEIIQADSKVVFQTIFTRVFTTTKMQRKMASPDEEIKIQEPQMSLSIHELHITA